MRALLLTLFGLLCALTVVAHTLVLPEERDGGAVTESYFSVGDDIDDPRVRALMDAFRAHAQAERLPAFDRFADLLTLDDEALSRRYRALFATYFEEQTGAPITDTVRLVWSTDANPAREVQMTLFRAWHLREYGEPVDITTDPSNRELTKSIVQSVAGAGPDLIEYIGASELRDLVDAGIALDITEYAESEGFGVATVFEAARSGIAHVDDAGQTRQYGYPCNVGYTVLLYHKDQFEAAGVEAPTRGWTIDEMRRAGEAIMAVEGMVGNPRFPFMNLGAGDAALGAGA
ncbi:MAG: extracellular solute-binding protein, partial [Planctomycetota bacterium]